MSDPEIQQPVLAPDPPASRNPFRTRDFGRWWLASILAGSGIGIQAVTVPLFLRDRVDFDVRALAISAALIAQTLPAAFLALVGGVVADRVERRRILVRTFSVAAVVSVAYVLLAGLDVSFVWPVFPLAVIVGAAGAFSNPARQAMLPQIVDRAQLQTAVILGTMGYLATLQFLGPMIGGLVADRWGLAPAFGLEVVLLALAALTFFSVATYEPPGTDRNVGQDLVAGLRYVKNEPIATGLLTLALIPGIFFIGPFSVTLPLLVPDIFEASDRWVGLLWGCFGGGVFAGSIVLSIARVSRRGLLVCLSTVMSGTVMTFYGLSETLAMAGSLLVAWGLGASIFINFVIALLQENTEQRMMGRVMSMYSLIFFASSPIGYGIAGLMTTQLGPQLTLAANGVLAAVVGIVCSVAMRTVRRLQ